jgi:hypothetical protein
MDLPPDVSAHLDRFSPSGSDIDLVAVTEHAADRGTLERLARLHLELARPGGTAAASRLNCLYVPAEALGDPGHLHDYWYEDRFTQRGAVVIGRAHHQVGSHPQAR